MLKSLGPSGLGHSFPIHTMDVAKIGFIRCAKETSENESYEFMCEFALG